MRMPGRTVHTMAVRGNGTITRDDLPEAACPCAAEGARNALHALQQKIPTSTTPSRLLLGMVVIFPPFFSNWRKKSIFFMHFFFDARSIFRHL